MTVEELKAKLKEMQTESQNLKDKIITLTEEKETASASVENLTKKVNTLEDDNQRLLGKNSELYEKVITQTSTEPQPSNEKISFDEIFKK